MLVEPVDSSLFYFILFLFCLIAFLFLYCKSMYNSIALRPAVSWFVPLSAANREYTGWLKDRV